LPLNPASFQRQWGGPVTHDKHIKALDGLRFIAALSVMVAHGTWYLVALQQDAARTPTLAIFMHLANFGMTLFFVLSGFVIHVNYRDLLPKPGGLKKFLLARWSRLYPLFFVVFVIQITYTVSYQGVTFDLLYPMPFYLTFTESWWYWPVYTVPAQNAYRVRAASCGRSRPRRSSICPTRLSQRA
jgi:peptidoglycan/LPS O-acetylase OafA/YrhL